MLCVCFFSFSLRLTFLWWCCCRCCFFPCSVHNPTYSYKKFLFAILFSSMLFTLHNHRRYSFSLICLYIYIFFFWISLNFVKIFFLFCHRRRFSCCCCCCWASVWYFSFNFFFCSYVYFFAIPLNVFSVFFYCTYYIFFIVLTFFELHWICDVVGVNVMRIFSCVVYFNIVKCPFALQIRNDKTLSALLG